MIEKAVVWSACLVFTSVLVSVFFSDTYRPGGYKFDLDITDEDINSITNKRNAKKKKIK